jgi:hypothetical protein
VRALSVIGLALSLCSCSYKFEVTPCREGQQLAFRISEQPGLLWGSSPWRLWKVVVYKRDKGRAYSAEQERWHTEDLRSTRDRYNLVLYGSRLRGWSVLKPAEPLHGEEEYWATIVGERGAHDDLAFIPAKVIAQCRISRGA